MPAAKTSEVRTPSAASTALRDSAAASYDVKASPGEPAAPLRVIVVEDSESDYELVLRTLRRSESMVDAVRVEDEPELRAALATGPCDVVISDHNLPHFDSAGARRVVREVAPEVPFIIVSGEIGEELAVDAILAGADDYVMKHSLGRLRASVERCLSAAALRREARETEARLAAIAHHFPGVMFQLRHDVASGVGHFVFLSEGASRLLGRPATGFIRDSRLFFDLTSATPGEPLWERLAACARTDSPLEWIGRIATPRRTVWVSVAASPRRIEPGIVLWDGVMVDISDLKSTEAELRASRAQLRELTAHSERLAEEERAAIARELHDDIGGTLAAIKLNLDWLRRRTTPDPRLGAVVADPRLGERLSDTENLVDTVLAASSRLASTLRPGVLDDGISAAIEVRSAEFGKRLGIPCRYRTNAPELFLPEEHSMALFRVVQEALTNVVKHAQARSVEIEFFVTDSNVTVEVRDDGRGLSGEDDLAKSGSFGVRGMNERATRLGGWVEVSGSPGQGTTVMVSLPLPGAGLGLENGA